jgi:hypothetical protein
MAKAYDRVKLSTSASEAFIRTSYWTPDVEVAFEEWAKAVAGDDPLTTIEGYLGTGVAVSFKQIQGSVCCTLANQACKDAGKPYLITGWSDNTSDALSVCEYKLLVMLGGLWDAPPPPPPSKRH